MTVQARKRLIVHNAIQGSLITRFAIHWIMFTCISCVLLVSFQMFFAISQPPETRYQHVRLTIGTFGIVSLALIPVFTLDLIRLSNRFVGPIVRMQSYLKIVGTEDVKPLKVRNNDYWQDLVADVNIAVERLSKNSRVNPVQPKVNADTHAMDEVLVTQEA